MIDQQQQDLRHHSSPTFAVNFTQLGKGSVVVDGISFSITAAELLALARSSSLDDIPDDAILRLICGGKTIAQDANSNSNSNTADDNHPFPPGTKIPKSGIVKVIVMGGTTTSNSIQTLNSQRSDPLMRGFSDNDKNSKLATSSSSSFWGPALQHDNPKSSHHYFRRLVECPDASFGTRPTSTTPHAFEARRLLERLSCDPGIAAVMSSRKLAVGTLGEMDPIDDVLMRKTRERSGGAACLLGYNTNHGLRIDIKLRTEDLTSFRPYRELVATLIHELSHNWVEDHDAVFWTNYAQMRVEYLWEHARWMMGGWFVNGKRTAALAEVEDMIRISPSPSTSSSSQRRSNSIHHGNQNNAHNKKEEEEDYQIMNNICQSVCQELEIQMTSQHHIPVSVISPGLITFGNELILESRKMHPQSSGGGGNSIDDGANNVRMRGQKLGGGDGDGSSEMEQTSKSSVGDGSAMPAGTATSMTVRERALAAAEKRRKESTAESKSGASTLNNDEHGRGGANSKGT